MWIVVLKDGAVGEYRAGDRLLVDPDTSPKPGDVVDIGGPDASVTLTRWEPEMPAEGVVLGRA